MQTPGISKDPDTDRLLSIVVWNLFRFFGYEEAAALDLVRTWYPNRADDFYHHEGAFRSAAFMHYSTAYEGSLDFGEWFRGQHFEEAEREALEHYRETYFEKH